MCPLKKMGDTWAMNASTKISQRSMHHLWRWTLLIVSHQHKLYKPTEAVTISIKQYNLVSAFAVKETTLNLLNISSTIVIRTEVLGLCFNNSLCLTFRKIKSTAVLLAQCNSKCGPQPDTSPQVIGYRHRIITGIPLWPYSNKILNCRKYKTQKNENMAQCS